MNRTFGLVTSLLLLAACTAEAGAASQTASGESSTAGLAPLTGTILFTVDGVMHTIDPSGDHQELVDLGDLTDVCCGRWSTNGEQILFPGGTEDGRITSAIVDADGSHLQLLPIERDGMNLVGGAWAPDDARIALQGWDDADQSRNGLYTSAVDGSDVVRLTINRLGSARRPGADVPGSYSPDGTRIAFGRYDPTRGGHLGSSAVFIVDIDGAHLRRLTPWLPGPMSATSDWSPDGKQIVYDYVDLDERNFKKHYTGEIFLIDVDGTNEQQIQIEIPAGIGEVDPDVAYFARQPSWSPDGSHIVFTMWPGWGTGDNELYTMRVDGTHLQQVTTGGEGEHEWADWKAGF